MVIKLAIFSFPMRYIPLEDPQKEDFVGTHWNPSTFVALQRMLIPTQGKGFPLGRSSRQISGKTLRNFVRALTNARSHLGWRGNFIHSEK